MRFCFAGPGAALLAAPLARADSGDELLLLEEIPSVMGASGYEQPVSDAPSSVTILTGEEIRRLGYDSLDEALGGVRGFLSEFDRYRPMLGVRGFGRPGDEVNRVLLLIDGHRVNSTIEGTASLHRDLPIPLEDIDRVEIIRGPSSSLYGANAMLGVINIITRRGRDLQGGEAGANGATAGTAGARAGSGWEVLASVREQPAATYFESDSWSVGVYAQEELELGPVTLDVGARHDRYASFGGTTNPRLALICHAGSSATFKALYGQAFRAPSAYESYDHDGGYSFAPPQGQLLPERTETAELVYEQAVGEPVRGTVVGFAYRVSDLIDVELQEDIGLLAFENQGSVEAVGGEAEVEARFGQWLGRESWTRQEVRDAATRAWIVNSPRNLGKLAISAPLWGERVFVSPEARFIGARLAGDGSEVAAASVVNVTVSSPRLLARGLSGSASVTNVLDSQHAMVVSDEFPQPTLPHARRGARMRLDYAF